MDYRETGGADSLDVNLRGAAAPARLRALDFLLRTRATLGLQPVTAPAVIFVPLGFAIGPQAMALLPRTSLSHLDPVITLALAALGIFIGMGLTARDAAERRLLAAASAESCITIAVVSGATLYLMSAWGMRVDMAASLVAAVLGVAASVSSAGAPEHAGSGTHRLATRVADLDDGLSVLAGAIVVAAVGASAPQDALRTIGQTMVVGLLGGVAGWLLFERAHSPAERAVFVIGTLALIGGSAQYVHGSPLLAGMLAGLCWRLLPGHADRIIRNDVSRFQHPLVILLLVTAGAFVEFSALAIWLLVPFVVFRLMGKVLGAYVAARLVSPLRTADLAAYLLPPGLLGIGLTLNFFQVSSTPLAAAVVSAVALGTLASELLALLALHGEAPD
jgi:hypothetical protein